MKTLIFVWTQKLSNVTEIHHVFGFGDMLRGTVGALRYCEERGYECIIDISLHPVSQLLMYKPHRFSDLIQENKDNIKFIAQYNTIKDIDAEFESKDVIYFFSNFNLDVLEEPASESIKKRVDDILKPNEYLESYISRLSASIPYNKFGVLHFRVGDDCLILQNDQTNSYSNYLDTIRSANNHEIPFILMTDSVRLKELSKDILFNLDGPVAHIGYHKDTEALKHTLAEFFILRKSHVILTHSTYFWISGFVKMINYIYDVQLIKI